MAGGKSHKDQLKEGTEKSLTRAGIYPSYHYRSLTQSQHQHAAMLTAWVANGSLTDEWRGLTLIGGNDMEDLTILTARGLHMTSRPVKVLHFMQFQEWAATDRQMLEDALDGVSCLTLLKTGPYKANDESLYSARETRTLEWLLENWVNSGKRLLLHCHVPFAMGWFTPQFVQRVATINEEVRG